MWSVFYHIQVKDVMENDGMHFFSVNHSQSTSRTSIIITECGMYAMVTWKL